jgi:histone demethylase JARID1
VALNKITVRLPEGEALQCLTERAMAWRDRAQKALDESDVAVALKKLSEQNKHDSSAASNSKPNKKGKSSKKVENSEDSEGPPSALDTSMTDSESGLDVEASNKSSEDPELKDKDAEPVKPFRPPEVKLSNKSLNTLEGLMLEGNLLEVSMDETQHIWRVLQATEPRRSKRYPDLNKLEEQLENVREEKIKAKKKRKLEIAEAQKSKNQEAESNEPKPKKAREDKSSPRKAPDGSGKKLQSRRKKKISESSEQEEEQEDCSANPKCQRPTGKEV